MSTVDGDEIPWMCSASLNNRPRITDGRLREMGVECISLMKRRGRLR